MQEVREAYNRCGSCRHFRPDREDRLRRVLGTCFGRPTRPEVAAADFGCGEYRVDPERLREGAFVPVGVLEAKGAPPVHRRPAIQEPGRIPVRTPEPTAPVRRTPRTPDEPEPARIRVQHIALEDEEGDSMDRATLKGILADVLDEALGLSDAPMHPKFRGGKVLVQPGNAELKPHELDIEVLFKKVVMVRDRLRVLEQKINAQDKLTADEKAQMQVYITGCYGSLTSFNYLFRERDDWFVGQAER